MASTEVGPARNIARIARSPAFRARYELGRVLGSGATGIVFLAEDLARKRAIALKFLTRIAQGSLLERFLQEARLLDRLQHPHVVRVHELGELERHPYLAMEHLEGGTLRDRLEDRIRLPLPEALALAADALDGLSACHEAGIVHRDLKPENVLFTGEGIAKLADLGIAKVQAGRGKLTETGAILGTPRYMAPEVVKGQPAGVAADVYAIGAVLYEALSGRPPLDSENLYALLRMHVDDEPAPLATLAPEVPPAVAAVVHRALAKDPARRPESAAAFREELARAGGPGERRAWIPLPPDELEDTAPRMKRPRRTRGVAGAAIAVLLATAGSLLHAFVPREGPVPVLDARPRRDLSGDRLPRGAVARLGTVRLRHAGARCLAASGGVLISGGRDGRVRVWNAASGEPLAALDAGGRVRAVALGGALVAYGGEDGTIRLAELPEGRPVRTLGAHAGEVTALALSPDGRRLASGSEDRTVRVFDVASGRETAAPVPAGAPVRAVSFSPDGSRIAVGVADGAVRLLDAATAREVAVLRARQGSLETLQWAPQGDVVAVAGEALEVWDARAMRLVVRRTDHGKGVTAVGFSPDGRRLVTAGRDHRVITWSTESWRPLASSATRGKRVRALVVSPDGAVVTSCGADSRIRRADALTGRELDEPAGPEVGLRALAFAGAEVLTAGDDGQVLRWEAGTGGLAGALAGRGAPALALAATGGHAAFARKGEPIALVAADASRRELAGHAESVHCLAFSPDGAHLASGSGDDTIRVWSSAADGTFRELSGSRGNVDALAFAPDGRTLWSGGTDARLRCWDLTDGQVVLQSADHGAALLALAVSPDGSTVASAGRDGTIRLRAAATGAPLHVLTGATAAARALAFAPGGALLASGGTDGIVHVWDVSTGRHVLALAGHEEPVTALAFAPDGRLASASEDCTALIWAWR